MNILCIYITIPIGKDWLLWSSDWCRDWARCLVTKQRYVILKDTIRERTTMSSTSHGNNADSPEQPMLSAQHLKAIFAFHIAFDAEMQITQALD